MTVIEVRTQCEMTETRIEATGLTEKIVYRHTEYTRITTDEQSSARTTRRRIRPSMPERFGREAQHLLTPIIWRLLVELITCISICTSPSPIEVGPPHELEGRTPMQDTVEVDASPFDIDCR